MSKVSVSVTSSHVWSIENPCPPVFLTYIYLGLSLSLYVHLTHVHFTHVCIPQPLERRTCNFPARPCMYFPALQGQSYRFSTFLGLESTAALKIVNSAVYQRLIDQGCSSGRQCAHNKELHVVGRKKKKKLLGVGLHAGSATYLLMYIFLPQNALSTALRKAARKRRREVTSSRTVHNSV
jgi:hypothetical protein